MTRPVPPVAAILLFSCAVIHAQQAALKIDAEFPGGNIVVAGDTKEDTVELRTDLRDTKGWWFYWCFRVTGAQGRTLTFRFTDRDPIGTRGPAVSLDAGDSWRWLGRTADTRSFTYTFPDTAGDVRFSFGMPYTQRRLDAFLKELGDHGSLRREILCESRKGRAVERLRVGRIDGTATRRVLITARAHACEMMTSYAVEGLVRAVLSDDERGRWLRENVEFTIIPFLDKDGVEDGDQGKNRQPRDHNRDYGTDSMYPEIRALKASIPAWSAGARLVTLDLHCPAIRGGVNERIYQVGGEDAAMETRALRFCQLLEKGRRGSLPYLAAENVPFGSEWNTAENYTAGVNAARWAAGLPGIDFATTFELPYADVHGVQVDAASAAAFGADVAGALMEYFR